MNTQERIQLCAMTGLSQGTVIRWDKGQNVNPSSNVALKNAAEKLGFTEHRIVLRVLNACRIIDQIESGKAERT